MTREKAEQPLEENYIALKLGMQQSEHIYLCLGQSRHTKERLQSNHIEHATHAHDAACR